MGNKMVGTGENSGVALTSEEFCTLATSVGRRNHIVIIRSVDDVGIGISRGGRDGQDVCVRSAAGKRAFYVVIRRARTRRSTSNLPARSPPSRPVPSARPVARQRRLETGSRDMADDVVIIFRHINTAVRREGYTIRQACRNPHRVYREPRPSHRNILYNGADPIIGSDTIKICHDTTGQHHL